MNSKERVLTAIANKPADRVPVNYLANPGIDGRLKEHFALDAKDDEGREVAGGIYFCQLYATKPIGTCKLILLRN